MLVRAPPDALRGAKAQERLRGDRRRREPVEGPGVVRVEATKVGLEMRGVGWVSHLLE